MSIFNVYTKVITDKNPCLNNSKNSSANKYKIMLSDQETLLCLINSLISNDFFFLVYHLKNCLAPWFSNSVFAL